MKFTYSLILFGCIIPNIVNSQSAPLLLKDIYPGDDHSYAQGFATINGSLLFSANDGTNGIEFWKSDGTEAGTSMVKNIGPDAASYCVSVYGCGPEFIVMDDILYFRASDNIHGAEIWRSDGTDAGTYMVKDINAGVGDCSNSTFMSNQYFTVLDNVIYFAADGGGNNIELWRSDGTEAGTYLVKDFAVGQSSVPKYISAIDGNLYFQCKNADDEPELWKSDGTDAGSILLKKMWAIGYDNDRGFIKFGDYIYFAGDDAEIPYNLELWRTDGTPSGTQLFLELNPEDDDGGDPREFHILNDKLIFCAKPESEVALMVSDGTPEGTVRLQDNEGHDFSAGFYQLPTEDKLYFQGNNDDNESGLWITDGTDNGTSFLLAIESGSFENSFATVVNGNNIVFSGYDDDNGCTAIFQSDGTPEGSVMTYPCDVLTYPYQMYNYNGQIIVEAESETTGNEPWIISPEFTTSVYDVELQTTIHLFPNPAINTITISVDDLLQNDITVLNAFGEIVYHSTLLSTTQTLEISFLSAGIYFLKAGHQITKFIKINA
ncbi:MAG: T9SS type A sorting domain-containing protein [Chitinophagales bacterium]|nr:T9SS type A sorting domain-containing protein [Chitinophagales bacterium]MBP9549582.1 T9SS type A sorting domain-containing protein [Chitinophagales bacterium]